MLNMVTPKDLVDNQEYGNIYKDVKEECFQYSAMEDLHISWLVKKDKTKFVAGDAGFQSALDAQHADKATGVGWVYVMFIDVWDAQAGLKALTGSLFAGWSIIVTVLNENSQMTPLLNLIFAPKPDAPPPLP